MRVAEGHRHEPLHSVAEDRAPPTDKADASDFVRLMGLVDTANGIAARVMPGEGELCLPQPGPADPHVPQARRPVVLGLDNAVSFGTDGIGLTSTVLHDLPRDPLAVPNRS